MSLFKPFGSSILGSTQPEGWNEPGGLLSPGRSLLGGTDFTALGGGARLAAPVTRAATPQPAWSDGRAEAPDQEDDIARPLEEFPHGRPPLTQDQTVRAYARMMGVHPSEVDPEKMQLKHDIRFEPVQRREREMYGGDAEPGPFNEPYDPNSDAVRGGKWKRLDPELAGRIRERIQGTRFEGDSPGQAENPRLGKALVHAGVCQGDGLGEPQLHRSERVRGE